MSNILREEIVKHVLSYYDNDASRDAAVDGLEALMSHVAVKFEVWLNSEYWNDLPDDLDMSAPYKDLFNFYANNIYNGKQ